MNALDWVLAAVILLLAIRCMTQGFVKEVLSVAAWVVGLLLALLFYKQAGALLAEKVGLSTLPELVGFLAVFLVAFLLVKLLAQLLRGALEAAHLAGADKALGLALGVVEGLVAVSLVLLVISVIPKELFDTSKLLEGSFFAKTLLPVVGPGIDKALKEAPKVQLPKVEMPKVQLPKVELPKAKP